MGFKFVTRKGICNSLNCIMWSEYHKVFHFSKFLSIYLYVIFLFYSGTVIYADDYIVLDSSLGMGLQLCQSSVGHSHNFCTIFTPAHLVGRTNCRSKIMWLGWYPSPSFGSLACLQEMDSSGDVSAVARSLNYLGYPCGCLGVSLH